MTSSLIGPSGFARLLVDDRPLLDVRAPVEFARGAFPAAVNLPILDDDERAQVGKRYQRDGPEAATRLGHELVSGQVREERIAAWQAFIADREGVCLYCFRGGQRSRIAQSWLDAAGSSVPRVEGGYKAMRRFLLDALPALAERLRLVVIGGKTGTGKTALLSASADAIDLEHLAHHRGSAFGKHLEPQPSQIDFENALVIQLLKAEHRGARRVLLEDESFLIGRISLPQVLYDRMQECEMVYIEDTLENRTARIHGEYIVEARAACVRVEGNERTGHQRFSEGLRSGLKSISKRLGGVRYARLESLLDGALEKQLAGDAEDHKAWIELLLTDYYDPMYEHQLAAKAPRVRFQGSPAAVLEWLAADDANRLQSPP